MKSLECVRRRSIKKESAGRAPHLLAVFAKKRFGNKSKKKREGGKEKRRGANADSRLFRNAEIFRS